MNGRNFLTPMYMHIFLYERVYYFKGQYMNKSTFFEIKYMNGLFFSKARYIIGVGFKILARTSVTK